MKSVLKHRVWTRGLPLLVGAVLAFASNAQAQTAEPSPFVFDLAVGVDSSLNGNINSGAIGRVQNLATAILPNPYGDVYGSGLHFKFGGGYVLNEESELRGVFTYQSADANLVRLGDIGPSSLYGQFTDYKVFSLDLGYRRYVPLPNSRLRVYGEATVGAAFVEDIDLLMTAPQANVVFNETDFYDQSAALTLGLNFGVLIPVMERMDLNAQFGLRRVGGLATVDQLVGTGLGDINNDSARLTLPFVVGVRIRF